MGATESRSCRLGRAHGALLRWRRRGTREMEFLSSSRKPMVFKWLCSLRQRFEKSRLMVDFRRRYPRSIADPMFNAR
jgi:hypothetical protein